MKKLFFLVLIIILLTVSCREDVFVAPEINGTGDIFVGSQPRGAEIFLDGEFTNKTTPSWLNNISSGERFIRLKLEGYLDTTVVVVIKDSTNEIINVLMNVE